MKEDIIHTIRKLSIIALASDDELVESLVLKGGNAIELSLQKDSGSFSRVSYDIDYSITDGDFKFDMEVIGARIEKTLSQTFLEHNYVIVDFSFKQKPKVIRNKVLDFWGGYLVRFKVIDRNTYLKYEGDSAKVSRNAIPLHPNNSNVYELEFSKHEYVAPRVKMNVDGYNILLYTPAMILFEKARAILPAASHL